MRMEKWFWLRLVLPKVIYFYIEPISSYQILTDLTVFGESATRADITYLYLMLLCIVKYSYCH